MSVSTARRHRCPVCDYTFDETVGAPREGFPAGTRWADIPDDWACPDCGVRDKVDFEPEPITERSTEEKK